MKKGIGIFMLLVTALFCISLVSLYVHSEYQWSNNVKSYWDLSDKSSTLVAKADYIDKFLGALKQGGMADNDALFFKTPGNSCDNNLQAVNTLKQRLDEIKNMDESSFQYQQAISQITQQEQGEADDLLSNLEGCWYKSNHYFLWNPLIVLLDFFVIMALIIFGIILLNSED